MNTARSYSQSRGAAGGGATGELGEGEGAQHGGEKREHLEREKQTATI